MTITHSAYATVAVFSLLLVACALLAAIVSHRVISLRVMDCPTSRSAHAQPVPKGGGLAILAVFLPGVPLAELLFQHMPDRADMTLLFATAGLGLFSWRDDIHPMPAAWKLLAQLAAALLVAWGCNASPSNAAAWIPFVVAVLWLVCLCNAMNFVDGLNGLASGCTLLACLVTAGLCLMAQAGVEIWGTALVLAAAIAGFLPFNFPHARLFMGDVGSQCCGLVLGALGLRMGGAHLPHAEMLMPLIVSGVLADVFATLLRRAWSRRPLMQAHREHFYQMAHRSGMNATRLTLLAWGGTLYGGIIAGVVAGGTATPLAGATLAGIAQLLWAAVVMRRVRHRPGLTW
ncbi:glycosyltransferase family 4 protein [Komagataeibacter saccharivorans]|uniref:glycosyltransferase family 4 protein n=1 Tax=Komagataeibacter saccharivorans TaxID=265959 RepID=UPI000C836358|nr:UDP-phosphate N-acetylglucosaminyl-1-phosphate transferase [Komagataeibacter saccharivorans]